jgi:hypothetical protein
MIKTLIIRCGLFAALTYLSPSHAALTNYGNGYYYDNEQNLTWAFAVALLNPDSTSCEQESGYFGGCGSIVPESPSLEPSDSIVPGPAPGTPYGDIGSDPDGSLADAIDTYTWTDAVTLAEEHAVGESNSWRLPGTDELFVGYSDGTFAIEVICDFAYTRSEPAGDCSGFESADLSPEFIYYWTSVSVFSHLNINSEPDNYGRFSWLYRVLYLPF